MAAMAARRPETLAGVGGRLTWASATNTTATIAIPPGGACDGASPPVPTDGSSPLLEPSVLVSCVDEPPTDGRAPRHPDPREDWAGDDAAGCPLARADTRGLGRRLDPWGIRLVEHPQLARGAAPRCVRSSTRPHRSDRGCAPGSGTAMVDHRGLARQPRETGPIVTRTDGIRVAAGRPGSGCAAPVSGRRQSPSR